MLVVVVDVLLSESVVDEVDAVLVSCAADDEVLWLDVAVEVLLGVDLLELVHEGDAEQHGGLLGEAATPLLLPELLQVARPEVGHQDDVAVMVLNQLVLHLVIHGG